MILGIGTDILKIEDICRMFTTDNDPFIKKTYTELEIKEARLRDIPLQYYATRFCGKEAVFKSLSLNSDGISLNEIEILNKENGQPTVNLYGKIKEHADKIGISEILISLSYDANYVVSYAMAQSKV